jgi:hypothetical protein
MDGQSIVIWTRQKNQMAKMLLAGLLASSAFAFPAVAQQSPAKPAVTDTRLTTWSPFQSTFYKRTWGVEIVGVKAVSSGYMLRFSYKVLDAKKAAELNNKKATPYLLDEASGTKLTVPVMEKVGQLRQSAPPKDGREYWIIFGNSSKVVQRGGVNVVIGSFHVDGLLVQ